MTHIPKLSLAVAGCALCCGAPALGSGGQVVFAGGTPAMQAQVRDALAVSSFDWDVLPQAIAVHIAPLEAGSYATPGNVYLDSSLLGSGEFSWGVVQHEFGHQVDFLLLHDDDRAQFEADLHAKDWCYEVPGLTHADQGCERFASELAWAYWPSPANSMRPADVGDESDGMQPAAFRALLAGVIGTPGTSSLGAVVAGAPTTHHAKRRALKL
jgi:hypothetical protein